MAITNLDLMGIFHAEEQEETAKRNAGKVDSRRKDLATAAVRKELRSGEAFQAVTKVLPKTDTKVRTVLAGVLTSIFARVSEGVATYTPFNFTPEGAISHPEYVINTLKGMEAVIPSTTGTVPVSYGALSNLSGITKSSMASTNAARQHLTVPALEKWRLALVAIGNANPDKAISQLNQHASTQHYLETLLAEWRNLDAPLPLGHIKEWAQEYAHDVTPESLEKLVADNTPTYESYLKSIIKVWREQYENNQMESYAGYASFLEVMKTKTTARRLGRGFNDMVTAVHTGLDNYNSRVTYPKTNFKAYKDRYNSCNAETGLSAEVLMGYCLFTGINPIAVIQWLAVQEASSPGTWTAERVYIPEDLIMWKGAISPRDGMNFYDAMQSLGLVSDQNAWAISLIHPTYTYKNLPTDAELSKALNDRLYDSVITEALKGVPSYNALADKVGYEYDTLFGQAYAHTEVLNAAHSKTCISGTVAGLIKNNGRKTAEDIEKELTELISKPREEALVDMKVRLLEMVAPKRNWATPNEENYAELEMKDGMLDPDKSYRSNGVYNPKIANAFYSEVLERTTKTMED